MPQCALVDSAPIENARPARGIAWLWLCGVLSVYSIAFLIYAETAAFTWDESYHLVAAQLIAAGKRPYLDFCFPQTPLNAYLNAGWMRLFGQSWRVPHTFEALFTIGGVLLMADYVFVRFPVPRWRFAAALTTGLATGLNAMMFTYAPVAQPYGICLLALAAAFRISLNGTDRKGTVPACAAGFCAGVAAGSSLLTAAAAPVLLVWMLVCNRAGSRWKKFVAWCIGMAVPFVPVLWLFWLGPRQTWFNVVQYHYFYRRLYWPETTQHDLEVLTSWIDSGQGLLLGPLALYGLYFIARKSQWTRAVKREFYLCAWLATGLGVEIGLAHPTFPQYFLLVVPFLAVPAVAGLYAAASRLFETERPLWPVLVVSALLVLGLGRALYDQRDDDQWSLYERLAKKVEEVTPPHASLFAQEPIYFLTKRLPPSGLELFYTHKLNLPAGEAALLHIVNQDDLKREVQSGMFATAYSCSNEDIADYGLKNLYAQHVEMDTCSIFWDWKK
jgi:hypothetical protein